ncbi:carboxypeptidase-like regulatory domain-containing protein [Larkinella rosea]|uniref:carboxypeptidase-like regulatory domain-containing protein n=1 Tax=Larkinella rosea TaxID=2025312 RepID=UPI00163995F2|nr:carboxypeptidase-like regulatory domain-containing protein [Larkinella rosea]
MEQSVVITEVVTDLADNQPTPGVSVALKGTNQGIITDGNRAFQLTVPDTKGTLVFSFIGYKSQEIPATNSSLSVRLEPDLRQLNEVVVVGYGTQDRKNLVGSVTQVTSKTVPWPASTSSYRGEPPGCSEDGRKTIKKI